MDQEIWLPIPGYEKRYLVSNLGRVKSLPRKARGRSSCVRMLQGKLKKPCVGTNTKYPYPVVGLWKKNVGHVFPIHRLVLAAFIGPCPLGMEACHNDGDPLNCQLSNLRWDTRSANQMDRVEHGTSSRGENHSLAKLTKEAVLEIRNSNDGSLELSKKFGVTRDHINVIKRKASWSYLN